MKTFIIIMLLLLVAPLCVAQQFTMGPNHVVYAGTLVKTVTNFTASTSDTSNYIGLPRPLMLAKELGLIVVSTDSIQANIDVIGDNQFVSDRSITYVDSISTLGGGAVAWAAATPKQVYIQIKAPGVDRIPGCTRFKIGQRTAATGTGEIGTTAGRTLKFYLVASW